VSLVIRVEGRPAPQGSKHEGAHGQMREASPYLPAWRAAVRNTAHRTLNALGVLVEARPYFRGAVVVRHLEFIVHPGQRVDSPPDIDKLIRGVLDPLKYAGVYEDDGRVVRIERASKRHPRPGEPLGCVIELDSFQESEINMESKLYRLVLEEVEVNGGSPVIVGQVVGDARMVESVLPALAQRLTGKQGSPRGVTVAESAPRPPETAEEAVAAAAGVEPPKRGRGRPSKAQKEAEAAALAAQQQAPANGGVVAPSAPPAAGTYDPFAAVAGQQR
jgi:hypothetical protein